MNKNLFVILGNQLFKPKLLKQLKCDHVFLAEDYQLCTYQKHHKLKLYLYLCAMREYRDELINSGLSVSYFKLEDRNSSQSYADLLCHFMSSHNHKVAHLFQIENKYFEKTIIKTTKENDLELIFHQSPMFMFSREEFNSMYSNKNNFRLSNFYKHVRKKFKILIDDSNEPIGGKWSFDEENRKKIPNNTVVPQLEKEKRSKHHRDIIGLIQKYFADHNGSLENIWFPVRRKDAEKQLKLFLKERLDKFGVYEDAMRENENFLYHSCISPLLNIGLITPGEIIDSASKVFDQGLAPINSIEGFIRQIIGWREFIRGVYQLKGNQQKKSNFWEHERLLKQSWYEGTTGIKPLDDNIKLTLRDGYNHHIPRLMVISNLMNLCQISPQNIYTWFMEMYIDSSDWVMVPNIFGMATYSDGGLMSTKPYTCSSNYILKMSNYKRGDWCDIVDGLYWRFIENHKNFYNSNPRLSFQLRLLGRMNPQRKKKIYELADEFLEENTIKK